MEEPRYSFVKDMFGALSATLGVLGLASLVFLIPYAIFGAHFMAGMGFREGPQPTPEQLHVAVWRQLHWVILHRLAPILLASVALLWFGVHMRRKQRRLLDRGTI